MRLSMSSILKTASEMKNPKDRVEFLRRHATLPFGQMIRLIYDERIKFDLPEGDPPYTPSEEFAMPSALYGEVKRMYVFVEGCSTISKAKRERRFVELLEYVDPQDAKLLLDMKEHRQPYPYMTKRTMEDIFPGVMDIEIPGVKLVAAV